MIKKHIALYPFNSTHVSGKFQTIPSQVLWALWVTLAAMTATAVYEITKLICFPRMSVVQSHIITIFFAGCVGFCISFVIRRRDMAAQQEPLRLAAVVENSDDAINSVDLDGTVTSWNRGAEHTYGYSAAEALGRHISFCLPPEKHGELNFLLQKIAAGEVIERFDTQRLTKSGTIIDVSLSISAIKDKTGTIVGVSGIGRDVTAQTQAQDALRESERRYRSLCEREIQRTRELTAANQQLAAEMIERRQAQESLRVEVKAREQAESMILHWITLVQKDAELTRIGLSFLDRTGHLPGLLADLISRLRLPMETKAEIAIAAREHGDLRRKQGYTAAMVVEESRILQVSIFNTLQNNLARVDFSRVLLDVMTIADEVDSQLKQAMLSYVEPPTSSWSAA